MRVSRIVLKPKPDTDTGVVCSFFLVISLADILALDKVIHTVVHLLSLLAYRLVQVSPLIRAKMSQAHLETPSAPGFFFFLLILTQGYVY